MARTVRDNKSLQINVSGPTEFPLPRARKPSLVLQPLPASLGARIEGLDLREPMGDSIQTILREALDKHLLLIFPEQSLSPAQLELFAMTFGTLQQHRYVSKLSGSNYVTEIKKEREHQYNFGGTWHFDLSFEAFPPTAMVLHAKELPRIGGDTVWSNQYAAYDHLDVSLKEIIAPLVATHTSRKAFEKMGATTECEHPLTPLHAHTNRRHLYVNPVSIDQVIGLDEAASNDLLKTLYQHAIQPEWNYRHIWQEGDLVVWDNLSCMHMAINDYPGERRIMHRVATLRQPKQAEN